VARLAPGFVPSFSATAFLFALAATAAWFWLVRWRTGRHRAALWKTLVLPAGGTALCWMLVMTLWLPVLDYARSYAPQVQMISQRVGDTPCISELGLQRAQMAALMHHGHYELRPLTGAQDCRWLLVNPDVIARLHSVIDLNLWRFDGTLRRPASDTDDLLLYQRIAP
jgi:4-amino-4-deoxy-L-arabinose transferase-like glycosyltransferase